MTRKYVFFVYDRRTTMTDFVASFAVREHAEKWGSRDVRRVRLRLRPWHASERPDVGWVILARTSSNKR